MIFRKFYMWVRKYLLGIDDRSAFEIAISNGMRVGENPNFQDGVIFDPSHSWLISIGNNVTIAPRVHILCHDASTKSALGYTKIGRVTIGNNVFIGANSIILPNTSVGDYCIIGANSVITHDIPSHTVAVGNPCKVLKSYEDYIEENRELLGRSPWFGDNYMIGRVTEEQKQEMIEKLKFTMGFIK